MEHVSEITKIRGNGTLYVEVSDFLNLASVKEQIARLMDSSIYKTLQQKKTEDAAQKSK